jgi:membrane protein
VNSPFKRSLLDASDRPLLRRGWLGRVYRLLSEDIWRLESSELSLVQRILRRTGRLGFLTVSGFLGDRCTVRASALTFVTVLSLVPLLAFSFAAMKGLGFYENLRDTVIKPGIERMLPTVESASAASTAGEPATSTTSEPATSAEPEQGSDHLTPASPLRESIDKIFNLVETTNFLTLQFIGLIVVVWAVLKLLGTIEDAFNDIWGVRRARSFVRKVTDYLSIVVIAPMFLLVAVGFTSAAQTSAFGAFLEHQLQLGWLIKIGVRLMPLMAGWVAFTFLYMAMPNTRTRLGSSALGGFVAGTAWQVALLLHVKFQVGVANYNALYSTFAAVPIFLVWVQLSWVIVLFGAELAFAHQHEHDFRRVVGWREATPAMRASVALRVLVRAVEGFLSGRGALSADETAQTLGVPAQAVDEVLEALRTAGVVESAGEPEAGRWLVARDPSSVRASDVLQVLEGTNTRGQLASKTGGDRAVDRLLEALELERRESAYNLSLLELVDRARALERDSEPAGLGAARAQPS